MHADWMLSASRILEGGWVGWGSTARSESAPLRSGDGEVAGSAARGASGGRGKRKLVGMNSQGAEVVELLDFGCGEGAIVDADVVEGSVE